MIILLDIDGVMIPAKSWKTPELLNDGFPEFSNQAVLALQRILKADTRIILTTSHKDRFSIEEWKRIFSLRGLAIECLECLPANTNYLNRKDEIINWFDNNRADNAFVIIDDDSSLNDLPLHLKNKLVRTSTHIGLTTEHINLVKEIVSNTN